MRSRRAKLIAGLFVLLAANVWLQGPAASCSISAVLQPGSVAELRSDTFVGKALKRVDRRGLSLEQSWRVEVQDDPDRGAQIVVRISQSTARVGKRSLTDGCFHGPTVGRGGVYRFVTRGLVDGEYDARGSYGVGGRYTEISAATPGNDDGTQDSGWMRAPRLGAALAFVLRVAVGASAIRVGRHRASGDVPDGRAE
jgi:hypothetical protein